LLTEAADVVPCVDDLISAFVRGLPYVASSSPILFLLLLLFSEIAFLVRPVLILFMVYRI
jgi:hypothetical protein